ncbi:sensor histidine kinase [Glycomyces mayteni]|uniref:histidine kinase n=1 Tax=Glycomyces mayteni TaxID=543887 RepID=A0ABW2DC03_9ACTN|nr:sensor histidine kinase [Glycomyces mayteni]
MLGILRAVRERSLKSSRSGVYLAEVLVAATATLVAAPLLCVPSLAQPWAEQHRRRAGALLGRPVEPRPRAARRNIVWLAAQIGLGLSSGAVAVLLAGCLLLTLVTAVLWWAFPWTPWLPVVSDPITDWGAAISLSAVNIFVLSGLAALVLPPLAGAHARCCLAILAPSPEERLVERVTELTRTRVDVLQAHSAELRRIERDLHDGTQARLVAIAMRLAVADETYAEDPGAAAVLVRQAQAETEEAMTELRSVIHTIYPPVLADQGLAGALATLAARAGVPVRLDVGPLGEVPAAVEAVAYFAATEALANTARHSGATEASISVARDGALLRLRIADNGIGGAHPARGTGLDGMRRRAAALDGAVTVDSPEGGPTVIALELPCA